MNPNTTYRSLSLLTLIVWLVSASRAAEPVKGSDDQVLFRIEPLTRIQQKFSYGIHSVYRDQAATDTWKFRLAAYKNRIFILKVSDENQYRVHTDFNGMEVEVRKLYVKFDGGSFLAPTIAYVILSGIDPMTDEVVTEIIGGQNDS